MSLFGSAFICSPQYNLSDNISAKLEELCLAVLVIREKNCFVLSSIMALMKWLRMEGHCTTIGALLSNESHCL